MISKFRKFIVTIALNLIVMGTATGGLMAGAEHVSGISTTQMQGFRQQVQGNAVKFAVNSGVRMAFGEKPKDVLKSGAANFVADVAAGVASNEISGWRQGTIGNGSLFDYTLHKGLHFATGAATRGGAEALMGGNSSAIHRAALSGGMGAATAEILGEKLALDALRSGRMHTGNVTEMMGHISTLSSQTAGLGAALTGLDVSHAQHAGSVAVENNLYALIKGAKELGSLARMAANQIGKKAVKEVVKTETKEVAKEAVKETAKSSSKEIAKNLKPGKLDKTRVANGNRFGKGGEQASKTAPHKNSLDYVGDSHTYVIRNGQGKIMKYGESSAGKNAMGQSKRAEAQVKKLRRQDSSSKYTSEVVREFDSKAAARASEAKYIKTHRKVFGKDSLPLNKNNR